MSSLYRTASFCLPMGFVLPHRLRNKALSSTPVVAVTFNDLMNSFSNSFQNKYIQDNRDKGSTRNKHKIFIKCMSNSSSHMSYKKFSM